MAKKKDSEALFEVITKSKGGGKGMPGLTIPEWMRKPAPPQPQPQDPTPSISDEPSDDDLSPLELPPPRPATAARAAPAAAPKPAPAVAPPAPSRPAPPRPMPTQPIMPAAKPAAVQPATVQPPAAAVVALPRAAPRRPLRMPQMLARTSDGQGQSLMATLIPVVKIENRQISVLVNPASAAVAVGGLVLLMMAMFVIGWASHRTTPPAPAGGLESARGVQGEQAQRRGDGPTPPQPSRTPGKYYMIVQGLGGKSAEDLQEAWRIEKFCNDAGSPVTVSLLQGQYVIYSLTGFDKTDHPSATEYAEKIKELGKRYKTQTQGREFKQTDPQGRWPWFLKYSGPGAVAG